jgi:hypothetical protein
LQESQIDREANVQNIAGDALHSSCGGRQGGRISGLPAVKRKKIFLYW